MNSLYHIFNLLFPKKYTYFILIVYALASSLQSNLYAKQILQKEQHILLISSDHNTDNWNKNVEKGLQNAFSLSIKSVDIEYIYLDNKYYGNRQIEQQIADMINIKNMLRPFDLIILSDDIAFSFLIKKANYLLDEQTIIITLFDTSHLIKDTKYITGFSEFIDYRNAFDVVLNLHPETKTIYFIGSDKNQFDKKILQSIENDIVPILKNAYNIEFSINQTLTDIQSNLNHLNENSLIYILSENLSRKKRTPHSPAETARSVASSTSHPVYSFWYSHLGHGVVGGKMLNGFDLGNATAKLALDILNNENKKDLLTIKEIPTSFIFDVEILDKFNIQSDKLPQWSRFINKKTLFQKNINLVFFILFIIAIIILLSVTLIYKKKNK